MSAISAIIKICKVKKIPSDIEDLIFEYLGGRKITTAHFDILYNICRNWDCDNMHNCIESPHFLIHLVRQVKFIKGFNKNFSLICKIFKMITDNHNKIFWDDIDEEAVAVSHSNNIENLLYFMIQYLEGREKHHDTHKFINIVRDEEGLYWVAINYIHYGFCELKFLMPSFFTEDINMKEIPRKISYYREKCSGKFEFTGIIEISH